MRSTPSRPKILLQGWFFSWNGFRSDSIRNVLIRMSNCNHRGYARDAWPLASPQVHFAVRRASVHPAHAAVSCAGARLLSLFLDIGYQGFGS